MYHQSILERTRSSPFPPKVFSKRYFEVASYKFCSPVSNLARSTHLKLVNGTLELEQLDIRTDLLKGLPPLFFL